jgi:hypothetical protein
MCSPRGEIALNISDFEALRTFGGRRSIPTLSAYPARASAPTKAEPMGAP